MLAGHGKYRSARSRAAPGRDSPAGGPPGNVLAMVALLLVAVSLGLSNFAASVGIGAAGVDARTRLRVGVIFGVFEAGMPIVGLLLGHGLASSLGHAARWIGAGLLIATGLYALAQAVFGREKDGPGPDVSQPIGRMLVTGALLYGTTQIVPQYFQQVLGFIPVQRQSTMSKRSQLYLKS